MPMDLCFSGGGGGYCLAGMLVDSDRGDKSSRSGRWIGVAAIGCGRCVGLISAEDASTNAGIGGTGGGADERVGLAGGER